MQDQLTQEERNQLRAFVATEAGRKLILLFANEELNCLAEGSRKSTTLEKQSQLINRMAGIHWVRTLIEDLISSK
jgi:hypothetical protein